MHGPNSTPYNPDRPTGGGNFNPGIKIDTSRISIAPPLPPGSFTGGMGGRPRWWPRGRRDGLWPPPDRSSGVSVRRGDTPLEATEQLQKGVDAWIGGVQWDRIPPYAHESLVKSTLDGMAARMGLRLSW